MEFARDFLQQTPASLCKTHLAADRELKNLYVNKCCLGLTDEFTRTILNRRTAAFKLDDTQSLKVCAGPNHFFAPT